MTAIFKMQLKQVVEEINTLLPILESYQPTLGNIKDARTIKVFNVFYEVNAFAFNNKSQCTIECLELPSNFEQEFKVQADTDQEEGEYWSFAHSYLTTLRSMHQEFKKQFPDHKVVIFE